MNEFDCLVHEMMLIRELTPFLSMASQTQFKQNYLRDIADVIMKYINLEVFFLTVYLFAFELENGVTMS